jgi:serine/threonine protein kinase
MLRTTKVKKIKTTINPARLEPNQASLIGHLYASISQHKTPNAGFAELAHVGKIKLLKKKYKVLVPDDVNSNQMVEHTIEFTSAITVYPLAEVNPDALTPIGIEALSYLHSHHAGVERFLAGKTYVAAVPHPVIQGAFIQRPIKLTKDIIVRDVVTVDAANLTTETTPLLQSLLATNPQQQFFDACCPESKCPKKHLVTLQDHAHPEVRIYQPILLKKSLVRFERKDRPGHKNDNHECRYAVCDENYLAKGMEGEIYKSIATIKLKDTKPVFKPKQAKAHVVKQMLPHYINGKIADLRSQADKARAEGGYLKNISLFGAKTPTINEDGTRAALVMQYIEGRTLADYVDADAGEYDKKTEMPVAGTGNIFTVDQRLEIGILACEWILNNVHAHKIIHRDIKPTNMMLRLDANQHPDLCVLIDFGLAKIKDTYVNEMVGSIDFLAPEILQGARASEMTDAYSLTITLKYLWQHLLSRDCSRYDALSNDHRDRIADILAAGSNRSPHARMGIERMLEAFTAIKNERRAVHVPTNSNKP